MLFRLPGVYAPQDDTWLLAAALREAALPAGGRFLELGTGTGALAVVAARLGARRVTAVDLSLRAAFCAQVNGLARRLPIRARRGDLYAAVAGQRFDVVVVNPPYVPARRAVTGGHSPARAWDAGPDGRDVLDRICAGAWSVLAPGGALLMVHSALSDVERSLHALRHAGLKAAVVARRRVPFGPVMRERAPLLAAAGLIEPGEENEELVVIRADRASPES